MFYTFNLHQIKKKYKFKPIFTFIIKHNANRMFVSFLPFPTFLLQQHITNFESPEHSLFALKVCLLSSGMFEQF